MKHIITAAVLLALIMVITPFFVYEGNSCASALGKHICVDVTCEQTQKPIPGLEVSLYLPDIEVPLFTGTTNAAGWVSFGSGMPDGCYIISYTWAGETQYERVCIDCSKITWQFHLTVENPTVIKRFVYNLQWWNPSYPPKAGLEVTVTDGESTWTETTDENGEITWSGDVGYTYTLTYKYGGVTHTETIGPIGIPESQEDLTVLVVNYLEPKSAEQLRFPLAKQVSDPYC